MNIALDEVMEGKRSELEANLNTQEEVWAISHKIKYKKWDYKMLQVL